MLYEIVVYETKNGKLPFNEWLIHLDDLIGRQKIRIRLERLSCGNFGDNKSLSEGIGELKIDYGPGYRVYYGKVGKSKILILNAGNKRTQDKDIEKAQSYFIDYKLRGKIHGKK